MSHENARSARELALPRRLRRGVVHLAALLGMSLTSAAGPGDAPFPWGADVNPGAGPKLSEAVEKELIGFIHLAPDARHKAAAALAKKRAVAAIEGWKRFRNPELCELARACLEHTDWHVVHRALLWIELLGDPQACALAWPRLIHPQASVREIAALTCLDTWSGEATRTIARGAARAELTARSAAEGDACVRQALAALGRRLDGKLAPRVVRAETVVRRADGLVWAPFVRGLRTLDEVALDVRVEPTEECAAPRVSELAAAIRFHAPLLGYGNPEEVPRITVQPFGNQRKDGTVVHTGQDVGACHDGAGFYAIADGVVCLITSGTDMGGGIVIAHRRDERTLVNAVYMHGGGTVFVAVGDAVTAGQLLGRQGLSFSIENGGQFAHLHLGLYPGPFRLDHNYGYRPAGQDLSDWLDPAACLPQWIAASGGR